MNTHTSADTWMHYILIVLGLIVVACAVSMILLAVLNQPISEMLIIPGIVAAVSLVRLLIPSLLI